MKTILAFSDPSHAWAKVKRKELEKLDILHKISMFSYQKGDYVYLEEDCDLTHYINKLKENNVEYKFKSSHTNRQSRIRTYDNFSL